MSSAALSSGTVDPDITVDIYNPELAWIGTTLFADYHIPERPRIIEVNMRGEIVWEYILPDELKAFTNPGFDVELLPNNNLLLLLPRNGVYEIDRTGKIAWSYLDREISHDADRLPNGNTLIVWGGSDAVDDAQVREVDPNGRVVWAWYAKDHFYRLPYKGIYIDGWTHTNSATRLPNGNTLISLRNFNMTVEVNPQGSVVWSSPSGAFTCPHSPKILPNGNLLVADTTWGPQDHRPGAVEVNRETGQIIWEFRPQVFTLIRDADRLPNGNTLIVTGDAIVEVTPEQRIVWWLRMNLPRQFQVGRQLYKAERIRTEAPNFTIESPQGSTYGLNQVDVSIRYSDTDLSTIWYRVYDRDKDAWITGDIIYVYNRWRDALTFERKETGTATITLNDGNYALHVWANSTGWGDLGENVFQPKIVNVAEAVAEFSIDTMPKATTVRTAAASVSTSVPWATLDIASYGAIAIFTFAIASLAIIVVKRKARPDTFHED